MSRHFRIEYARGPVFDTWRRLETAATIEDARKMMKDSIGSIIDQDSNCWTALQYEADHAELNDVVSFDETAWRIVEDDE